MILISLTPARSILIGWWYVNDLEPVPRPSELSLSASLNLDNPGYTIYRVSCYRLPVVVRAFVQWQNHGLITRTSVSLLRRRKRGGLHVGN